MIYRFVHATLAFLIVGCSSMPELKGAPVPALEELHNSVTAFYNAEKNKIGKSTTPILLKHEKMICPMKSLLST